MDSRVLLNSVGILSSAVLLTLMIPFAQASSTEFELTLVGDSVIDLKSDDKDRMVRVYVEFVNFDLSDKYFLMNVIQSSTGKIVSQSEINVGSTADGVVNFNSFVSYLVNEQDICADEQDDTSVQSFCSNVMTGDYEIQITSKDGILAKSVPFSIV